MSDSVKGNRTARESLLQLRLTVDEYGTVWLGEPGSGEAVGDLIDRDQETLQIVWREPEPTSVLQGERLDYNQAKAKITTFLSMLQNASHAEHFGPLCPVCGLVTRLQGVLRDAR